MKRRIYWLIIAVSCLLLLWLILAVLYPLIPDTPAAKHGFQAMTGLDPTEVSGIYYQYHPEFISGGDEEYIRFTYPDEFWFHRFLGHLSLTRLNDPDGGSDGTSAPDWWDCRSIPLTDCYVGGSTHPPNKIVLKVDRFYKCIYLYFGNPQRRSLGSSKVKSSFGPGW